MKLMDDDKLGAAQEGKRWVTSYIVNTDVSGKFHLSLFDFLICRSRALLCKYVVGLHVIFYFLFYFYFLLSIDQE